MTKSTAPATKENKTTTTKSAYKSLKKAKCPTLLGSGIIDFEISSKGSGELFIGLTGNSGTGYFSKERVSIIVILDTLETWREKHPVTALALKNVYPTNSNTNNWGFLLSVLLELGLVTRATDSPRHFKLSDPAPFLDSMKAVETKPKHKTPSKRKPKAKA